MGAPKRWGARRGGGPEGLGRPKISRFFSLSRRKFHSFFSLWGVFSWAMAHPKCGFLLVLFCVSPGGRQATPSTNRHQQAPTSNTKQQQATTSNNKQQRATTSNNEQQRATPSSIKQHSTGTNRHQQAPTGTNRHQQAPTGTNRHQQAPTGTNRHQQATTGNNRQQQATTGNNRQQQATTGNNRQQTTNKHNNNTRNFDQNTKTLKLAKCGFGQAVWRNPGMTCVSPSSQQPPGTGAAKIRKTPRLPARMENYLRQMPKTTFRKSLHLAGTPGRDQHRSPPRAATEPAREPGEEHQQGREDHREQRQERPAGRTRRNLNKGENPSTSRRAAGREPRRRRSPILPSAQEE